MISSDIVPTQPGRIIVHATDGDVHWIATEDNWCVDGKPMNRRTVFLPGLTR